MHLFNIKSLLGLADDDESRRSTSPGSTIQLSDDDSRAPSPTGTINLSSDDDDTSRQRLNDDDQPFMKILKEKTGESKSRNTRHIDFTVCFTSTAQTATNPKQQMAGPLQDYMKAHLLAEIHQRVFSSKSFHRTGSKTLQFRSGRLSRTRQML